MPYGLTDIELQKIINVFASNRRIVNAILYGSRAKGNFKPFSDIDITLVGKELTRNDLIKIIQDVDNLLLPYQFDLSLWNKIKNEALIEHIERIGISIYKRDKDSETS